MVISEEEGVAVKGARRNNRCDGLFNVWNNEKQDALTFDKEYAKNLKKIFLTD